MAKKSQIIRFVLTAAGLALLAVFLYWLLPVAVQSRLSADHVRRVFSESDSVPVVGETLSSLWIGLLTLMKSFGFGVGAETFAAAAALNGWIALLAIGILSLYAPWPAVVLCALAPAVLWTSVVPNSFAISLLFLVLSGWLSNPTVSVATNRARWCLGAVVDGLGCSMNPFSWLLALRREFLSRVAGTRGSGQIRLARGLLFAAGLSFPFALGILLDGPAAVSSFAGLPIVGFVREFMFEDTLGAGRVILGSGGETAIAMCAGFSGFAAVMLSPLWIGPRLPHMRLSGKLLHVCAWAFLVSPFVITIVIGHPKAWRLAHAGWNTVIEDFARNVERGVSRPTVAIVQTSTEEAALRYAGALLEKTSNVAAFRLVNFFEPWTVERITKQVPKYQLTPTMPGEIWAPDLAMITEKVVAPNTERGVQFWLDFPPERSQGLEIQFIANGYRVSNLSGQTKFITSREGLRASHIRARPTLAEYLAGPSIETYVFARYAVYHLAVAGIIEREKRTTDWERRARGEYYAALKKVEWLRDAHTKVCVEPEKAEGAAIAKAAAEGRTVKRAEPLDVCAETAWYY